MDKSLLQLISTIVGASLAVVGGFFSNYIMQNKLKNQDRKKLTREKLEEAYLLANELDKWLNEQMKGIASLSIDKDFDNPIDRISMLIKCYGETESEKIVDSITISLEQFRTAAFNFFVEAYETEKKPSKNSFLATQEPFEKSRELIRDLQNKIRYEIRSNI